MTNISREEVEALLRKHLRIVLQGETYHGERDVITGARITDASITEAANALIASVPRPPATDALTEAELTP